MVGIFSVVTVIVGFIWYMRNKNKLIDETGKKNIDAEFQKRQQEILNNPTKIPSTLQVL